MTVYGCGRGRLELILLGKQGLPVEIRADGILYEARHRPARRGLAGQRCDAARRGRKDGVASVHGHEPGLVGSTRFTFVRES